jgi:hypothetical protein
MAAFPRYGEPWAKCSVCGLDHPRSKLRYHKRFGWQCVGVGADCWAGGPHRDENRPVYRPGEGVRKTAAPLTNTATEGL